MDIFKEFDEKYGANAPEVAFKNWELHDEFKTWLTTKLKEIMKEVIGEPIDTGDMWNPTDPSMAKEIG